MNHFQSKVILITGSSSGIGEEIAKKFAKQEANLAITGRNGENLAKVAMQCKELGASEVLEIVTDLSEKENMEMVMAKTIDKFGRLDVLINNAGMSNFDTIRDFSLEVYDKVMSINTRTPLYMTQLAIPHLEKTKGNIVNMSSMFSTIYNNSLMFSYCLSKTALDRLTKMSALDLANSGIRVNSVNPGYTDTPMLRGGAEVYNITFDEIKNDLANSHPLNKRFVETSEVAEAVFFLASEKASMITGISLPVDGGKLLSG